MPQKAAGRFDPVAGCCWPAGPIFAAFTVLPGVPGGYLAYVPEQVGPGDRLHVLRVDGPGAPSVRLEPLLLEPAQCLNAHMLLIAPDGVSAQLICEGDQRGPGSFLWLDLPGRRVLGVAATGVFPDGLALVPGTGAAQP